MEDVTVCTVCMERFDANALVPTLLSCGHTLCRKCVADLHQSGGNAITCPLCRKVTRRPPTVLPSNFAVLAMLEIVGNQVPRWCSECKVLADATCEEQHLTYPWRREQAKQLKLSLENDAALEHSLEKKLTDMVAQITELLKKLAVALQEVSKSRADNEEALSLLDKNLRASGAELDRALGTIEQARRKRVDNSDLGDQSLDFMRSARQCEVVVLEQHGRTWRGNFSLEDSNSALVLAMVSAMQRAQMLAPEDGKELQKPREAQVEPGAAQQEAKVAQEQPNVAQQEPKVAQEQPKVAQQEPKVAQQEPRVAQQEPRLVEQEPAPSPAASPVVCPSPVTFTPAARRLPRLPLLDLDLDFLARSAPPVQERRLKETLLARARKHGVRRIDKFYMMDEAWALEMLKIVAPTLEELCVVFPQPHIIKVVHALPVLKRLETVLASRCRSQVLPPRQATLKWIRAQGLSWETLVSLVQSHSPTLDELVLEVGTPGDEAWPKACNDLKVFFEECGLRDRPETRVVLWRKPNCKHKGSGCRAQMAAVRTVLKSATVLCELCDNVEMEDF